MPFDLPDTAAYSPPPLMLEPSGRRGAAERQSLPPPVGFATSLGDAEAGDDPIADYLAHIVHRQRSILLAQLAIAERLRDVRFDAQATGDPVSESSIQNFEEFLRKFPSARRPSVFLLDNGNVRALWLNEQKEQVGLQFLGDREVQFVIFARRPALMAREHGIEFSFLNANAHPIERGRAFAGLSRGTLSMPASGDHVPSGDHLLRYFDKKYVDKGTGEVEGGGFLGRKGEGPPSANWMECFELPVLNQVTEIASVKRITYEKRGRLARIHVGRTIQHVMENAAAVGSLSFVHDPLDATDRYPSDPSHVLMRGVPEINTSEGEFVRDLLRECVLDLFAPPLD